MRDGRHWTYHGCSQDIFDAGTTKIMETVDDGEWAVEAIPTYLVLRISLLYSKRIFWAYWTNELLAEIEKRY